MALYEHRVATESFIWDINGFDQYGVEYGKVLATGFRNIFASEGERDLSTVDVPSPAMFRHFLANKQ